MLLKKHKNKSTKLIRRQSKAFTIIELLIGVAVLSVAAFISIPIYQAYKTKLDTAIAVKDIVNIQVAVESYYQANDVYPNSLTDVSMNLLLDPWGAPYVYRTNA